MAEKSLAGARVLLTGAAGFVGFHLTRRLLAAGATVAGLDSLNDYYDVGLKRARLAELEQLPGFAFTRGDLTDYPLVDGLFRQATPDYVVHLAAQAGVRYSITHPRAYVSANVDGFLSVLEACRAHPVRHLLYASSSSVYGTNRKVPFAEDDPVLAPVSLYAATKRSNELMAQTYAHLYRVPSSGLRFFTVYGPWGRPDMAYFGFTRAILEGRPIDVYGDGTSERDFTYIDDVTEAITRLVRLPPSEAGLETGVLVDEVPHALYNIGNHTPVPLNRFIAAIERATGKTAHRRLLPMQPGDVPRTFADVGRLAAVTGFRPTTSLEDGIAHFVAWYRAFHAC